MKRRIKIMSVEIHDIFENQKDLQNGIDYISNTFAGVIGQLRDDNAQQARVITQLNIELEKERRNHERNLAQMRRHFEGTPDIDGTIVEVDKNKGVCGLVDENTNRCKNCNLKVKTFPYHMRG